MKNASGFGMGYFNPRSREGSDFKGYRKIVKIHRFQSSLPRGERRLTQSMLGTCRYFNPRSREGSDKRRPQKIWRITHFNPRSREGSDINLAWLLLISQNFNPRSREGSDGQEGQSVCCPLCISILAPARGATPNNRSRI